MLYQPVDEPVQFVKNFDDVPEKRRSYPLLAQEKYDGVFAYGLVVPEDERIFSRTGKQCYSLSHIEDAMAQLSRHPSIEPCVILFEVFCPGMVQSDISGNFRSTKRQFPEAVAMVFDVIPYDDFVAGECTVPYSFRHNRLLDICDFAKLADLPIFPVCILDEAHNEEHCRLIATEIIERGGEGAVFKDPDGLWRAGARNETQMKIKQDYEFDLEVIGLSPGEGKYADTTGALVCRFKKFGKQAGAVTEIEVSGMTDKERHAWWKDPDSIIGKIVLVKAMKVSTLGLLREPRYRGIRHDKSKADF